jgi:CspA family cold shock protein
MTPLIAKGRVSWFNLGKKFGFVELESGMGDAFLHVSVLKEAGYVSVPAGTTLRVKVEHERGRQRIVAVLSVDASTANPGEPPPVVRKAVARPDGAGDRIQPPETPVPHMPAK